MKSNDKNNQETSQKKDTKDSQVQKSQSLQETEKKIDEAIMRAFKPKEENKK